MEIVLENALSRAVVRSRGGELVSFAEKSTGREYIWQGKKGVWEDHCYNIFPFAGRLRGDVYTLAGVPYRMPLHGFLLQSELTLGKRTESEVSFFLESDEKTLAVYPFPFRYEVTIALRDRGVCFSYCAENRGTQTMYCQFGAHPGFNLPFEEGADFKDYRLKFGGKTKRLFLDGDRLFTGNTEELPENTLRLSHEIFADSARMYRTDGGRVRLERAGGRRAIELRFEGFPYLVLWSQGEEKLLCVEPWGSRTVTRTGEDALENRKDLLTLAPGERATRNWSFEVTI